jgi:hypothetical protein
MYVMFTYVFVFAAVSLYREWEPIIAFVMDRAVSLKPKDPIPRSHGDRGILILQSIISNISASSKPYAKRESGP